MTHSFFPHRFSGAEARLLYVEQPRGTEAPPSTPEANVNAFDAKLAMREAQSRMHKAGEQMQRLQRSLEQLQQFKQRLESTDETTKEKAQKEAEEHGITDAGNDGLVDDVQAKIDEQKAQLQEHATTAGQASAEVDQHLSTIESSGPGGKLDAAFLRLDAVLKNPAAGMGEKLAAVIMAFAEMQNLVKGMMPSSAPAPAPGGGPEESGASTPEGKIASVRDMMKETGKTNLTDVRTAKQADVTNRQAAVRNLETALPGSKTALQNAQNDLDAKRAALDAAPGDPAKQADVVAAEQTVATQQAAVQTIEQQLQAAKDALAAAEEQVKTIDGVAEDVQKRADTYNQSSLRLQAGLTVLSGNLDAASQQKADIDVMNTVLNTGSAAVAANGVDIEFKLPAGHDPTKFQEPFARAKIDTASFGLNPDGSFEHPEALLDGIQALMRTVEADAEK